jgi:methanogenic corrinoid protein MtbC1
MVITIMRGVGFEVRDLGINVPAGQFVNEVVQFQPDILGLSALLTTMPEMRTVIEELNVAGLRQSVKVIVGGAPVNAKFAASIGSDGYAPDAGEAVTLAKKLLEAQ